MHKRYSFLFALFVMLGYLGSKFLAVESDGLSRAANEVTNVRSALVDVSSVIEQIISGENVTTCPTEADLQACLDRNIGNIVILEDGIYDLSRGLVIPSGTQLISRKNTIIRLDDEANMPHKGGFVVGVIGTVDNEMTGVTFIHNGVIDGNKSVHYYERSGNEGIKVDYSSDITIFGSGIVQNVSGDGVDLDATRDSVVAGLKVRDNSGSGVHFGSGRPIKSSDNIQVLGVVSENNGFKSDRSGLDVSWPNLNSVTYAWCSASDNYRNWEVDGAGSIVFRGVNGQEAEQSEFGGAVLNEVNGVVDINYMTNIGYIIELLKRDVRMLLGMEVQEYMLPLTYFRE